MESDKSAFVIAYALVAISGGSMGILIGIFIGWIIWG
jgi:hypothetical protein